MWIMRSYKELDYQAQLQTVRRSIPNVWDDKGSMEADGRWNEWEREWRAHATEGVLGYQLPGKEEQLGQWSPLGNGRTDGRQEGGSAVQHNYAEAEVCREQFVVSEGT
eukprot:11931409-Heterocapsa_arctica.AAC.1